MIKYAAEIKAIAHSEWSLRNETRTKADSPMAE